MVWLILIAVLVIVGIMFGLKFLRNVQPSDLELEEDLKELKQKIKQFKGGFVPWTAEISANELDQVLEKGNTRTGNGVFLDLSSNPIFAYAFRKYIGPGNRNALVYILSLDHEYVFRLSMKGTEVTVDGEKQGLIRENGVMYDRLNNEIGKIKRHGASGTNTIFIGEKEIAKVALPDAVAARQALEMKEINLQPREKELVQTMTVYELVNNIGEIEG